MDAARPVHVAREGDHIRLVFAYDPALVDKVRQLPFAAFDQESKTWTVMLCDESVRALRSWFYEGLCDQPVDDLVGEDEELAACPPAVLYHGTARRPYQVRTAFRDDTLYARLRSIPSASWEKKSQSVTFGPAAAVALRELFEEGLLSDREGLLASAETTVAFDARDGSFKVFGDSRAQAAFDKHFPERDIVAAWQDKGLSVDFADPFSAEVYAGEVARVSSAWQPDDLKLDLYEYQRQAVAVALARSGFGVYDSPGLGKTAIGIAWGAELLKTLGRVVVVCPGSVRTQWRDEIARFAGHDDVVIVDGSAKKRAEAYEQAKEARWLIVHFDVLHRDLAQLSPLVSGAALVVDEAHRCFPAGTMVTTEHGPVPIERIVDDGFSARVAGVDADGEVGWVKVVSGMKSAAPATLVEIEHEHGTLTATGDHPVWVVGRGYVDARDVRCGDRLAFIDGRPGPIPGDCRVLGVSSIDSFVDVVYNLEVAGEHNYFADGVLVHNCKNPTAKRTKALNTLGRAAARRLALTGTPVESVPDEFFNVMSFAVPGCLGGTQDFLNRYMFPNRWGGFEGARNLDELRRRTKWHYIRHTKAEVATWLPPLRVKHMALDPDTTYANALKRAHRDARDEIAKERRERAVRTGQAGMLDGETLDELEAGSEMTAVGMLRSICTSPRLLHRSQAPAAKALCEAGVVPEIDGPKLDELRQIASEMQLVGERVVIFTYSRMMADLIAERFDEDGTRYVCYTGETSEADRETARRRFVDPDDDVTAFIATDAGSEGLNLGKCCATLINVDIPWTPTKLEQRSNRIHRVDGTAERYLVINMTLRGTIEEGILKMVEAKADLSDSIFGETGFRERTTGRRRRFVPVYDMLDNEQYTA